VAQSIRVAINPQWVRYKQVIEPTVCQIFSFAYCPTTEASRTTVSLHLRDLNKFVRLAVEGRPLSQRARQPSG
jgi:hypothetical protein